MTILLTGGCGYIGSHVAELLTGNKEKFVVLDNLSFSRASSLPQGATFVEGDCRNLQLITTLIKKHAISEVMHFAGAILVGESVVKPHYYYENNILSTLTLLEAVKNAGIKRFILSSTAAVYETKNTNLTENDFKNPSNPYGRSKLAGEWILEDIAHAAGISYAILRYFNVAGASKSGRIGPNRDNPTHLMEVASRLGAGTVNSVSSIPKEIFINGTDFSTPDGSCVRDYVHVEDLADAHILALEYLRKNHSERIAEIFNCGYGRGFSVMEVLEEFKKQSPTPLKLTKGPRRLGDCDRLVADSTKIQKTLKWKPHYNELAFIVKSALNWETTRQKSK